MNEGSTRKKGLLGWSTNHVTVVESIDSRKITQKIVTLNRKMRVAIFLFHYFFTSNYLKK